MNSETITAHIAPSSFKTNKIPVLTGRSGHKVLPIPRRYFQLILAGKGNQICLINFHQVYELHSKAVHVFRNS